MLVFNGDILSGVDIAALVDAHRERGADVTLHLSRVTDPRPFGLVPTDAEGWVTAFREKPQRPEDIVTDQINAGCYVFQRSLIDEIPAGRRVSVERETFPGLLSRRREGARRGRAVLLAGPGHAGGVRQGLGRPGDGRRDLLRGARPRPSAAAPRPWCWPAPRIAEDAVADAGTTVGSGAVIESGAARQRLGPGSPARSSAPARR